jgi:centromere protein C
LQVIVCITGAVRVLVHRTEFSIGPGGMFKIPRGNSYEIKNLTDIDAFLYFFQAREITAVVDDGADDADK